MKDFEVLAQESKERGLKIVMDFVPNHSSNEHNWFLKSEQREDPYTDYYIWRDSNESNPGNYFLACNYSLRYLVTFFTPRWSS